MVFLMNIIYVKTCTTSPFNLAIFITELIKIHFIKLILIIVESGLLLLIKTKAVKK